MSSTPLDSQTAAEPKKGGLPVWLTTILILGLVALGGWVLWLGWNGQLNLPGGKPRIIGTPQELMERQSAERRTEWQLRQTREPDGIRNAQRGPGFDIKVDQINVRASRRSGNEPYSLSVRFIAVDSVIPPADRTVLDLRQRTRDKAVADHLKITPEQTAAMQSIQGGWQLNLPMEDRTVATTLIDTWESATGDAKVAAQEAVLAKLREVLPLRVTEHKASVTERAEQLKKIITPEQISLFENMGR